MNGEPSVQAALQAVLDALRILEESVPEWDQQAFHEALARVGASVEALASVTAPASPAPLGVEPATPPVPTTPTAEEVVAGINAYQVNGLPWWKSREPTVIVQYDDRAQLDLEEKVVGAYGWRRGELAEGLRTTKKPGGFDLSFTFRGKRPRNEIEVLWVRDPR